MQVEINHPHAEAIAAYYSGKRIAVKGIDTYLSYDKNGYMTFRNPEGYEIEPEVEVRYSAILGINALISATQFNCIKKLLNYYGEDDILNKDFVCKKTYTDGVLTALELVKVTENV